MIETELDTTDFEVMPDGTIKLYSYFNDIQKVSMAITKNRLIIEQFSQMGRLGRLFYKTCGRCK